MWKKALVTVWRDCLQSVDSGQWTVDSDQRTVISRQSFMVTDLAGLINQGENRMNRMVLRVAFVLFAASAMLIPSNLLAQTAAAAPEVKTPGATPQTAPVSEWQKE